MTYGCVDAFLTVLDEYRNLARSWRLEDLGELSDSLLQNLRWANVDFSDYDHDWDVQSQSNTEMLSVYC